MYIENSKNGVVYYTRVNAENGVYAARVYREQLPRPGKNWEHSVSSYTTFETRHKARHYADAMCKSLAANHAYAN